MLHNGQQAAFVQRRDGFHRAFVIFAAVIPDRDFEAPVCDDSAYIDVKLLLPFRTDRRAGG
ncbi:hypothetical protein D3C71_2217690 [compost metagenome]